jgi:pimeloyl-ACP methyl ester carboxylesterase
VENTRSGAYVDAGGVRTYYERTGSGDPLVLLHMAADTIALLDAISVSNAHLVGFSDGAVVALRVALERPDLVNRLVLIGQLICHDGLPDYARTMIRNFSRQMLLPFLKELYAATSPDGVPSISTSASRSCATS